MPRFFSSNIRRRLAPLFLVVALLFVGHFAQNDLPRDQEVRFVLTPTQQDVRVVRIRYLEAGEQVSAVEFRPRGGSPHDLVHNPSLKPGPYDMAIELEDQSGHVRALSRRLTVPSDPVTIRLGEPKAP